MKQWFPKHWTLGKDVQWSLRVGGQWIQQSMELPHVRHKEGLQTSVKAEGPEDFLEWRDSAESPGEESV